MNFCCFFRPPKAKSIVNPFNGSDNIILRESNLGRFELELKIADSHKNKELEYVIEVIAKLIRITEEARSGVELIGIPLDQVAEKKSERCELTYGNVIYNCSDESEKVVLQLRFADCDVFHSDNLLAIIKYQQRMLTHLFETMRLPRAYRELPDVLNLPKELVNIIHQYCFSVGIISYEMNIIEKIEMRLVKKNDFELNEKLLKYLSAKQQLKNIDELNESFCELCWCFFIKTKGRVNVPSSIIKQFGENFEEIQKSKLMASVLNLKKSEITDSFNSINKK